MGKPWRRSLAARTGGPVKPPGLARCGTACSSLPARIGSRRGGKKKTPPFGIVDMPQVAGLSGVGLPIRRRNAASGSGACAQRLRVPLTRWIADPAPAELLKEGRPFDLPSASVLLLAVASCAAERLMGLD